MPVLLHLLSLVGRAMRAVWVLLLFVGCGGRGTRGGQFVVAGGDSLVARDNWAFFFWRGEIRRALFP